MHVVITGGAGMIGRRIAERLLSGGEVAIDGAGRPLERLTLVDVAPPRPPLDDPRVSVVTGDVTADPNTLAPLREADLVIHLAAVVSGEAEADFDKGYRVNLDGTRAMLETCRAGGRVPRVVYASSAAAFGGNLPARLDDGTIPNPQTSYGVQKVIGEFLVSDYTRKGMIDGRALRIPTIVVRPGRPNKAASGFMSSIVREPLAGQPVVCPVGREARMWVLSPRRIVDAFVHAADLPSEAWGVERSLNLAGISATVGEMVDAMTELAGPEPARLIEWTQDALIEKIVAGWPPDFDTPRALAMGFRPDASVRDIVQAFIDDDLDAQKALAAA